MKESQFNAIPEKERMNRVLQGTAFYACVHKPDYSGQKNFGSPPEFKVTLGLDKQNIEYWRQYFGYEQLEIRKLLLSNINLVLTKWDYKSIFLLFGLL